MDAVCGARRPLASASAGAWAHLRNAGTALVRRQGRRTLPRPSVAHLGAGQHTAVAPSGVGRQVHPAEQPTWCGQLHLAWWQGSVWAVLLAAPQHQVHVVEVVVPTLQPARVGEGGHMSIPSPLRLQLLPKLRGLCRAELGRAWQGFVVSSAKPTALHLAFGASEQEENRRRLPKLEMGHVHSMYVFCTPLAHCSYISSSTRAAATLAWSAVMPCVRLMAPCSACARRSLSIPARKPSSPS